MKVRQLGIGRYEQGISRANAVSEVEYLESLKQGFCICNVGIIICLGEQSRGWYEDYKGLGAVPRDS